MINPLKELQKVKTLLVDDDEQIRDSLRMVFDARGCFIKVTETAEESLRALGEEKFDIIISDLRLPGIDGLRFAALIQPKPVKLLITAYKDDHVLDVTERIGVNEFVEKPFSVKALTELLVLLLRRKGERTSTN